ncbi:uncharacterized protein LOC132359991 [Balaenoptera ricei]|uniref:uncharacterized protein LOC132359991 n=1 Tax=Balaenoptera ricei TaxID=2746895 RepID=UPI0028BD7AB6|nr:uncharacterized protein LOC132359991 [Balaenoptera ricei]XP_059770986.1 uncharacterized protein LOC132359991 [Balaenoptera ricei]
MLCACYLHFLGGEEVAQEDPCLGAPLSHPGCGGHLTSLLSFSVSPSVNSEWHPLPAWMDRGANAVLRVGSAPSRALERRKGSGPGPCRRLWELGVGHLRGRLFPPGGSRGSGSRRPWGLCGPRLLRCPGRGATHIQGLCRWLGKRPVGARSPEIVFPQLSEMCPGALQPPGSSTGWAAFPSQVRGSRGRCLSARGLQKWSQDPGPLALASPEPVSRPCCLLDCFPMYSLYFGRKRVCTVLLNLSSPLLTCLPPHPPPPPRRGWGLFVLALPTPGTPWFCAVSFLCTGQDLCTCVLCACVCL